MHSEPNEPARNSSPGKPKGGPASWRNPRPVAPARATGGQVPSRKRLWTARPFSSDRLPATVTLGSLVIVLVASILAFLWYVFNPKVATLFVHIAAVSNKDYLLLPPLALVAEDRERFEKTFEARGFRRKEFRFSSVSAPINKDDFHNALITQLGAWKGTLVNSFTGPPPVIIYICAHGAVNGDGEPCLILNDAEPRDSSKWMRLKELWELLGDGKEVPWLPDAKKLVLLDCDRIQEHWPIGILHNTFAERAAASAKHSPVRNLAVINSADAGEVAWIAPELGGSLFAYYVAAGLAGEADGMVGAVKGTGNGKVTLQELADYLRHRVNGWACSNRGTTQRPRLTKKAGADFTVAFVSDQQVEPKPLDSKSKDTKRFDEFWGRHELMAKKTDELWRRHEVMTKLSESAISPKQVNPVGWAEFEYRLTRLEALLFAGKDFDKQFELERKVAEDLAGKLENLKVKIVATVSLPLGRAAGEIEEPPSQNDANKFRTVWLAKAQQPDKPAPTLNNMKYLTRAELGLRQFEKDSIARTELQRLCRLVTLESETPEIVEMHFARMLANYADESVPPTDIASALRTRMEAERAAAPADERCQYMVQPIVDAADVKRRKAEDLLFVGNPEALEEARKLWTELNGENGQSYKVAVKQAERADQMFRFRDRALAEIPNHARWFAATKRAGRTRGSPTWEKLREAMTECRSLMKTLDPPAEPGGKLPEQSAEQLRQKFEGLLEDLRSPLNGHVKDLKDKEAPGNLGAQTVHEIWELLSTPLVTCEDRTMLRNWLRDQFRKPPLAPEEPESSADDTGEKSRADAAYLSELVDGKFHPALLTLTELDKDGELTLTELGKDGELKLKLPGDLALPSDPKDSKFYSQCVQVLEREGEWLREEWLKQKLLKSARESVVSARDKKPDDARKPLSRADLTARRAAALLAERPLWTDAEDPTLQLRNLDWCRLCLWHADRTLDDFYGLGPVRDLKKAFFAETYDRLVQSVKELDPSLSYGGTQLEKLKDKQKRLIETELTLDAHSLSLDEADRAATLTVDISPTPPFLTGALAVFVAAGSDYAHSLQLSVPSPRKDLRRRKLDAAPQERSMTQELARKDLQSVTSLEAIALYRGHVWQVSVTSGTTLKYVWEMPQPPVPTIYVGGRGEQPTSVMFLFDCSGSMRYDMQGKLMMTPRYTLAQKALGNIVDEMPKGIRCGLTAFSRRAKVQAWYDYRDYKVNVRPGAPQLAYEIGQPNKDVEPVIPMKPLDEQSKGEFATKLPILKPPDDYALTPLYYSINFCLEQLIPEPGIRRIVVITDGNNDEIPLDRKNRNSNEYVKYPKAGVDVDQLERVMNDPRAVGICVDVILFGAAPNDELLRLTGDLPNRFNYYEAPDDTELLKRLREASGLSKFTASPKGAAESEAWDAGKPHPLSNWPGQETDYQIRYLATTPPATMERTIYPGDRVELYYNPNENKLERKRLDASATYPSKDVRDEPLRVATHKFSQDSIKRLEKVPLPYRRPGTAWFLASIQNKDFTQGSLRPKSLWAEISPAGKTTDRPLRVIYDLDFEPYNSEPMLRLAVPNWPAEEKFARIDLYFSMSDTDNPGDAVRDVQDKDDFDVAGFPPGIKFHVKTEAAPGGGGGYIVTIEERHGEPNPDLHSARVLMTGRPRSIHRTLWTDRKPPTVQHVFEFDGDPLRERIRITPKQQIHEQSAHVELNVPVDLTTDADAASQPAGK